MTTHKFGINKKAKKELSRRGITSKKGILLYQSKLSLGYINGMTLEKSITRTNTQVREQR